MLPEPMTIRARVWYAAGLMHHTADNQSPGEVPAPASSLPDVIATGLSVLFCGINPGVKAAAQGHHFIGRGNRFWRVMHLSGFTPSLMSAQDDRTLLDHRCGLTTAVARPTARADQLDGSEFTAAAASLEAKVKAYAPDYLAFLGKAAFSAIARQKEVQWGLQPSRWGGARVWVLPNPSGLNRGFSLDELVTAYSELRKAVDAG